MLVRNIFVNNLEDIVMADCKNCEGAAVLGYGTTMEAQDAQGAWVLICGITNFSGPSASRGEIDVTTLCSQAKEYVLDLKDFGTVEMSGLLLHGNAGQMLLDELFNSGEKTKFRLTLVDDGYGNGRVVMLFEGRVQNQPITVAQGAANQISFTIRITGDVTIERPDSLGKRMEYSSFVLNESTDNKGSVEGAVVVTLRDATFAGTTGGYLPGVSFTGVPAGLTGVCTRTGNTSAVISFAGLATAHSSGDSAHVGVTFTDAAFSNAAATEVTDASGKVITINFKD